MADEELGRRDRAFVEAAQAGSRHAFDELAKRYFPLVYTVGYTLLRNRESAEDLAQEVFLRVFLHLKDFDPSRPFAPWLSRIARNLAHDWLRRGRRTSQVVQMVLLDEEEIDRVEDATVGVREQIERREQNRALEEAVFHLPPEQREIVLMRYMSDMSQAQIARQLGLHPVAVGRQLRRALRRLQAATEPVLKESLSLGSPRRGAAVRTIAIVGVAASLGESSRSALATTLAKGGGAAAVADALELPILGGGGFVKTTLAAIGKTFPLVAGGGMVMASGKGVAVVVAAVVVAGGLFLATRDHRSAKQQERTQAGAPQTVHDISGVSQTEAGAVRAALAHYQDLVKRGDFAKMVNDVYDLEVIAVVMASDVAHAKAVLARGLSMASPEIIQMRERVGTDTLDSISLDQTKAANIRMATGTEIAGKMVVVRSGDFSWYFRQTPSGWKLVSQEVSGETEKLFTQRMRERMKRMR